MNLPLLPHLAFSFPSLEVQQRRAATMDLCFLSSDDEWTASAQMAMQAASSSLAFSSSGELQAIMAATTAEFG
nr:hypothetical protein Itr_chr08CG11040 [Ipomoea trifida]